MSTADDTSGIIAGWYEDPADPARLRRWDGEQWTQDVILAPDQSPVAHTADPVQPEPVPPVPAAPEPIAPEPMPPAPPTPEPMPIPPTPTPPAPQQTSTSGLPPVGQPVPPSPAPTFTPPGAPTIPRPSPPVNNSSPSSGPVSLPEWATLPGLTLPPDLSSLPGMESNSVLSAPTFAEPEPEPEPSTPGPDSLADSVLRPPRFSQAPPAEQRELPKMPAFEPPFIPQRPDVQEVGRKPDASEKPVADVPAVPSVPYAPPPSGAQYDVPPPPGMAHVPSSAPVLPRSAFVAPQPVTNSWPTLPPVGASALPPEPLAPPTAGTGVGLATQPAPGVGTVWVWLIAALPLVQIVVIYVVFHLLKVQLAPGMQWGILAAPAAFSLFFANADRKSLTSMDAPAPSALLGLIPPAYLIARCVMTGRGSVLPLIAWIVLQLAAAAALYFVLPTVLAAGISSFG